MRPYLGVDTSNIKLSTTILGHPVSMPICIAPMGMQNEIDSRADHIPAAGKYQ